MAIDYGEKRIGLAVCDRSETIVSPLCQLTTNKNTDRVIEQIGQIVVENQIEAIVVGLPINMDDTEGPQAEKSRQFAKKLTGRTGRPIEFQDERLSSAAADELLAEVKLTKNKKKQKRDMLAACDILQSFLDQKKL